MILGLNSKKTIPLPRESTERVQVTSSDAHHHPGYDDILVTNDEIVFTVLLMTTEGEPLGHGARYRGADLVAAVAKLLSHEDVAYVEVHDGSCSLGVWR